MQIVSHVMIPQRYCMKRLHLTPPFVLRTKQVRFKHTLQELQEVEQKEGCHFLTLTNYLSLNVLESTAYIVTTKEVREDLISYLSIYEHYFA